MKFSLKIYLEILAHLRGGTCYFIDKFMVKGASVGPHRLLGSSGSAFSRPSPPLPILGHNTQKSSPEITEEDTATSEHVSQGWGFHVQEG